MFRRSLALLSKQRTIVRDPRKASKPRASVPAVGAQEPSTEIQTQHQQQLARNPMPFEPSPQNQQSVGSTLGSYMLMGAGVAMGFTLIGALFGGVG
jgi:hypothetical protein